EHRELCPSGADRRDPPQSPVEAPQNTGIGTRQQEKAFATTGLHRSPAAQDRGIALNHQLGTATAKRPRPDLVFYQYRRSGTAGIRRMNFFTPGAIAWPGSPSPPHRTLWAPALPGTTPPPP